MRVSSIRYQPIEGGTLGGHFALHVTLGADDDPESFILSPTELATMIHNNYKSLNLRSEIIRGVLFDSRNAYGIETSEMLSLVGTLRDWGMFIDAWVDEYKRCAWFEKVNYLTVFLHSENWPNFRVNEIRFEPKGDNWAEPEIFEVNQNAPGYVYPGADTGKVLAFISNAKRPWGVILPVRSSYAVNFPIESGI
jgi:hypothetical protein